MTVWVVAAKDLRLFLRDVPALLFTVLVPIAVIAIVGGTLGGGEEARIRLPVVNEDEGPVAEVLLETLGAHVDLVEVDLETAERWVGVENEAAAALVLPEGMSKRYLTDRASRLRLLTDPVKTYELGAIKAYLLLAEREAAAVADPLFEELLTIEEQNLTGTRIQITAFEQNVPGFSVMFVVMSVLFGVAFALRDEQDLGAIARLRMAPVPLAAILAGKLLARFALGVAQMLLLFAFGHLVFGISLGSSLALFLLLTLCVVFCMTGFALLVSCFVRSREQIIPLGLTVVMLVCSIGGCWWPFFMEPYWLQQVARALPATWAMLGVTDLVLRDRTFVEVAPVLGVLLAYGGVCLAAGLRFHPFASQPG